MVNFMRGPMVIIGQTPVPTGSIEQLFGYGVLGVMFVLVMLGILVPKWVLDEYRTREKFYQTVIERLTTAVETMGNRLDSIEAKK